MSVTNCEAEEVRPVEGKAEDGYGYASILSGRLCPPTTTGDR